MQKIVKIIYKDGYVKNIFTSGCVNNIGNYKIRILDSC